MKSFRKYARENKIIRGFYSRYLSSFVIRYRPRRKALEQSRKLNKIKNLKLIHDHSIHHEIRDVKVTITPFFKNFQGSLIVSSDFELNWGGRFSRNKNRENYGFQTRQIFDDLIEILDFHKVPITWATVGHLFLDSCLKKDSLPHIDMLRPSGFYNNKNWIFDKGDWYFHDPCTDISSDPNWYGSDLINKIIKSKVNHEIASHSFSHIDFSSETTSSELADCEIKQCIKLAKRMSIDLRSFVFPGNFEGHHNVLKNNNFTSYRGYGGVETVSYPLKKNGMWDIHQSMIVKPSQKDLVNKTKIYFDAAKRAQGVCHLWFHPFELTKPFIQNEFNSILTLANKYKENLWITTMRDLANYMENRDNVDITIERSENKINISIKNNVKAPFEKIPITIIVELSNNFKMESVSTNGKEQFYNKLQDNLVFEISPDYPVSISGKSIS